ncbi:MAG: glycosyltransferase family 2 protein [Armatimonadota bacterium]
MKCINCSKTLSDNESKNKRAKTALIIPAYNEEGRISAVLKAAYDAKYINEIIVVDDGSSDNTSKEASQFEKIKLITLPNNMGKAAAMKKGAESTDAEVILFLDADLVGMDGEKIDAIIEPVINGKSEVSIGIFKGGRNITDLAQIIAPYISGQRAIKRDIFLSIPNLDYARSGVESAITKYCKAKGHVIERVVLYGCTHWMKEEKRGRLRGFICRLIMYFEIIKVLLDDGIIR